MNVMAIQKKDKIDIVFKIFRENKLDILLLQEVAQSPYWINNRVNILLNNQNNRGTAIIYRKELKTKNEKLSTTNRIMSVSIEGIQIVNVYGPSGSSPQD